MLRFTFFPDARIRTDDLPQLIREMGGALRYVPGTPPALLWRARNLLEAGKRPVTEILRELLDRFAACFLPDEETKENT